MSPITPTIALLRQPLITILLGAATGALCLGLGGRLAMRLFALATSRPPAFSAGGTLVVTFAGAIAGVLGSVLLIATRRVLPARSWLRGAVFAGLCYALASPASGLPDRWCSRCSLRCFWPMGWRSCSWTRV